MGTPCFRGRLRIALLTLSLAGVASAQDPNILQLQYSADIGANIVGATQFAARKDYVTDDLLGTRLRVSVPAPPSSPRPSGRAIRGIPAVRP